MAGFVALVCLFVYLADDTCLPFWDTRANVELSLLPLSSPIHQRIGPFTAQENPWATKWKIKKPDGGVAVGTIHAWSDAFYGVNFGFFRDQGKIQEQEEQYFVVKNAKGMLSNTFGPIPGIIGAFLNLIRQPFLSGKYQSIFQSGKTLAAISVSITAALIFLLAEQYLPIISALILTAIFAFGTSAFSLLSQGFWQQTVSLLLLTTGLYLLFLKTSVAKKSWSLLASGFFLGLAAATRVPEIFILIAAWATLVVSGAKKRDIAAFSASAMIPLLAISFFNHKIFGSPFLFAQSVRGLTEAARKTGATGLWSTPFLEGFFGNLVSPGRGLFIYSPILLLSVWGSLLVWRKNEYLEYRFLSVAIFLQICLSSLWFDWWGGWTFGNRTLADLSAPLTLLAIVAMKEINWQWISKLSVGILFFYSVIIQGLGAYVYDDVSWNLGNHLVSPGSESSILLSQVAANQRSRSLPSGSRIESQEIDNQKYRYRLWRWKDNPIQFYLTHVTESREQREVFKNFQ